MKNKHNLYIGLFLMTILIAATCKTAPKKETQPYLPENTTFEQTIKDKDGNVYPVVKIGNQTWMAQDLKVKSFALGGAPKEINVVTADWDYIEEDLYADPVRYTYGTQQSVYNFGTLTDTRNICPEGWHVPSKQEWDQLIAHLGGAKEAGIKLKSTENWGEYATWDDEGNLTGNVENGNGTNESGFTAQPSASIDGAGVLNDYGDNQHVCYWSSTEHSNFPKKAYRYCLYTMDKEIMLKDDFKSGGNSVRCIKN